MLDRIYFILIVAGILAAGSAVAQQKLYRWVDANGKVHYTDKIPIEAAGRASDSLDKQGTVVKHNDAALTPEQIQAREQARKQKIDDEAKAKDEKRKNTALLNTYSSEKDIDEARARALQQADEAIDAVKKRIAEAKKRKVDYDKEKEFYVKTPMPAKMQQSISENENELKNQQGLLDVKMKDLAAINAKYDEDKRRYIELTRGKSDAASPVEKAQSSAKK